MKPEKIACIVFLILALLISLGLSKVPSLHSDSLPNIGMEGYSNKLTGAVVQEIISDPVAVTNLRDAIQTVEVKPYTQPTSLPTFAPTFGPTSAPTFGPTSAPTSPPTSAPTFAPTFAPTSALTSAPTFAPPFAPTFAPTSAPTANANELLYKPKDMDSNIEYLEIYAIKQSGKENEVLEHKYKIMNGVKELNNIIQTGKTTTNQIVNITMLEDIMISMYNSSSSLIQYAIKVQPNTTRLIEDIRVNVIKSYHIIRRGIFDISLLALRKIDEPQWQMYKDEKYDPTNLYNAV